MFNNAMIQGLLSQLLMSRFGMQPGGVGQPGGGGQYGNLGLLSQQNPMNIAPQLQMFNPTAGQQVSAPLPAAPPTPHAPFQMPPQTPKPFGIG